MKIRFCSTQANKVFSIIWGNKQALELELLQQHLKNVPLSYEILTLVSIIIQQD